MLAEMAQSQQLADELAPNVPRGWSARTAEAVASVGGGSFSDAEVPTRLLLWEGPHDQLEQVHQILRAGDPAVVARITQEGLGVDLRTVAPPEYPLVADALRAAWQRLNEEPKR